jgi:hypothetical protein
MNARSWDSANGFAWLTAGLWTNRPFSAGPHNDHIRRPMCSGVIASLVGVAYRSMRIGSRLVLPDEVSDWRLRTGVVAGWDETCLRSRRERLRDWGETVPCAACRRATTGDGANEDLAVGLPAWANPLHAVQQPLWRVIGQDPRPGVVRHRGWCVDLVGSRGHKRRRPLSGGRRRG